MKIKFIAQGLDIAKSKPTGNEIISALKCSDYKTFAAFVAFVSVDGLNQLKNSIESFSKAKDRKIKFFIGVDLHGTSKEALEFLLKLPVTTYVVYSPNKIVYHPKIYSFEGKDKNMVIIGSSNLTLSGLFQNMEASLCVCGENDNEEDRTLLSDIYDYYNSLLLDKSPSCQLLTQELIDLLVESKIVLSAKENRIQRNKQNKENKASSEYVDKVNKVFGKLKVERAPITKKSVIEDVYVENKKEKKAPAVYSRSIEINGKSMWIESGKMTGGSRNILDLSKNGKRDKMLKPGSVEFFGVKKDDYNEIKNIDIIYNDKIYHGNTIKYAPRNSNWRIQLKGETDDGDKMTYLSNPGLGFPGGLINKILVFEKKGKDKYALHIFDSTYLDQFKDLSLDWAYGGTGKGRAYGFIN